MNFYNLECIIQYLGIHIIKSKQAMASKLSKYPHHELCYLVYYRCFRLNILLQVK